MKVPLKRHFSWLDALLRAVGYSPTVMLRWNIFWDRRGIFGAKRSRRPNATKPMGTLVPHLTQRQMHGVRGLLRVSLLARWDDRLYTCRL